MSTLTEYATRLLIEIALTATQRYSSEDRIVNTYKYKGALLNEPSISKQVSDVYWGIQQQDEITLQFSNADGSFTALADAEEFRNKVVTIKRYEPFEETPVSFELSGTITRYKCGDIFEITVGNLDPFQSPYPIKTYETGDWSESPPNIINPASDLGKAYPLAFGYCKKIPLRYIHANYTNNYFDYIIGPGPIESNNSNKATTTVIYRDQTIATNTDYYVHGGETTIQYTDANFGMSAGAANPYILNGVSYAFVRFKLEQLDYFENPIEIYASIRGLKLGADVSATRNFARVIQYILSNSAWGLGLTVNTTAFDTAAALITNLYCDGFMIDQKTCQDWLDYLLRACKGGNLDKNESGQWELTIDVYDATIAEYFGSGDGKHENIIEILDYGKTPTDEAIKNYTLNYYWNEWKGEYSLKNTRAVMPFGEDIVEDNPFISDGETADRITCYVENLQYYGDKRLSIRVGMEGRALAVRKVTNVNIPRFNINGNFQIRSIEKELNNFILNTISYSSSIYDYVAGDIPPNPNADDISITLPDPPTNLAIDSSNIYTSPDGYKSAYVILKADIPATNATKIIFGFRKYGESIWTLIDGQLFSGSTWKVRIDGLMQATAYDYIAISSNVLDNVSTGNPTLTNQTTASDSSTPAIPTGFTAIAGPGKAVSLNWTDNVEDDFSEYRVYRNTTGITPTKGVSPFKEVSRSRYIDSVDIVYGTLYYFWVSAVDTSENESNLSGPQSVTPTLDLSMGSGVNICNQRYVDFEEESLPPMSVANGVATLDATVWYFGDKSLKLVASAADCYAVLSYSYAYNISITPNKKWIISAYVRASAASKPGELFILTAAGSYNVVFTTSPTPNTWTRVYGVVNLSADASKTAVFRVDNNENGVSMWFDALMMEEAIGSGDTPSAFAYPGISITDGPLAPTSFTRTGEDTYQASDGRTLAYETFSWVNPVDQWKYTNLLYRRNGSTEWNIADQTTGTTGKIDDLTPGLNYDFAVQGVSAFGVLGTLSSIISRVAPGDTTAPAQVTGLAAAQGVGIITLTWTANTEKDLHHYNVYRGGVKIFEAFANKYPDSNLTYDVSYTYYIRAVDNTGNEGTASSSVAQTARQTDTSDLKDVAVNNAKVYGDLSASKIIINPSINNLCRDGDLEVGDLSKEWIPTALDTLVTTPVRNGKYALRSEGNGIDRWLEQRGDNAFIPCIPDDKYYCEGYHRHSAAGLGNSYITYVFYDANKNFVIGGDLGGDPGITWTKRSQVFTAPAGCYFVKFYTHVSALLTAGEYAYFDDIVFYKQEDAGSYIKDLTVDTIKIVNQAVTIPIAAFVGGPVPIPAYTETILVQASITSTGAPILVMVSAIFIISNPSTDINMRLYRDSTLIAQHSIVTDDPDIAYAYSKSDFTPGSGAHIYYLKVYAAAAQAAVQCSMALLETKK